MGSFPVESEASRNVAATRGLFVRLLRYAVPASLLLWGWRYWGDLRAGLGSLDFSGFLGWTWSRARDVEGIEWEKLGLGLGLLHAVVAGVVVLRRKFRWEPGAMFLASRQEAAKIGKTSALLVLPFVWDTVLVLLGFLRGFRPRAGALPGTAAGKAEKALDVLRDLTAAFEGHGRRISFLETFRKSPGLPAVSRAPVPGIEERLERMEHSVYARHPDGGLLPPSPSRPSLENAVLELERRLAEIEDRTAEEEGEIEMVEENVDP